MENFGELLHYYREDELDLSRKQLAAALTEGSIYSINEAQIGQWEDNQELDKITDSVFTLLVTTLETLGKETRGWNEQHIKTMKSQLRQALQNTALEKNTFGNLLKHYREEIGLSHAAFHKALNITDKPDLNYIATLEKGGKPTVAFLLASYDFFVKGSCDSQPVLNDLKDQAAYLNAGFIAFEKEIDKKPEKAGEKTNYQEMILQGNNYTPLYYAQLYKEIRLIFSTPENILSQGAIAKLFNTERSDISRAEAGKLRFNKKITIEALPLFDQQKQQMPDFEEKRARLIEILGALITKNPSTKSLGDEELKEKYKIPPSKEVYSTLGR